MTRPTRIVFWLTLVLCYGLPETAALPSWVAHPTLQLAQPPARKTQTLAQARTQVRARRAATRRAPQRGTSPGLWGTTSGATTTRAQRIPNPPGIGRFATTPNMNGVIETYAIFIEATQTYEAFTVYAPALPGGQRAPLLTAFHAYGVGWLGIQHFSELLPEVIQRGWFLVAPWQRNTAPGANPNVSYASVQSQHHVEKVLEFVLPRNPIDRDRIYGIGFSMGGGNALSYAARHRDRGAGAFAAVVNHTGTAALSHVYANASPDVQRLMEHTFGGTPTTAPFEYQRSSLVELGAGGILDTNGVHMARNLSRVPVQSWYNTADIRVELVQQTLEFDRFMDTLPGSQAEIVAVAPLASCGALGQHCWDTVDRTLALNWLAAHTLDASPDFGEVCVDRNSRWGVFGVQQAQAGEFTSFTFALHAVNNSLEFRAARHLAEVGVDLWDAGLRTDQPLALKVDGTTAGPRRYVLGGWAVRPASVQRDSVALLEDCTGMGVTSGWCFDPVEGTVTITATDMAQVLWEILP